MDKEQLMQLNAFLSEVGDVHIYPVEKFANRYSEWPTIRKVLRDHDCINEKNGRFGIDERMPVGYLRSIYKERLDNMLRDEQRLLEEKRFRRYQNIYWAVSLTLLTITTVLSLLQFAK